MPNSEDRGPTRGTGDLVSRSHARGCVRFLLARFPHIQAASLRLLEQNEAFCELCEEYEACTEAEERLERHRSDEAMLREYRALRLRLEGELLRYISQQRGSNASR
jgi:hypothetical protein